MLKNEIFSIVYDAHFQCVCVCVYTISRNSITMLINSFKLWNFVCSIQLKWHLPHWPVPFLACSLTILSFACTMFHVNSFPNAIHSSRSNHSCSHHHTSTIWINKSDIVCHSIVFSLSFTRSVHIRKCVNAVAFHLVHKWCCFLVLSTRFSCLPLQVSYFFHIENI